MENHNLPSTVNEAVQWILGKLDADRKNIIRDIPDDYELIDFHFTLGIAIRNHLGLHGENTNLIKSCLKEMGYIKSEKDEIRLIDADGISSFLLKKVWKRLKEGS